MTIRELLRASLWCLFFALVLSNAFTYAQNLWLVPYPPIQMSDHPWMEISSGDDSHKPESTIIKTTAIPTVTRLSPTTWIITFQRTKNY
jgi:hypothetical protein